MGSLSRVFIVRAKFEVRASDYTVIKAKMSSITVNVNANPAFFLFTV